MAREGWNRKSLSWLLIASLAFNTGVGVAFGVLTYRKHAAPSEPNERKGHWERRGRGGPLDPVAVGRWPLRPTQPAQTGSIGSEDEQVASIAEGDRVDVIADLEVLADDGGQQLANEPVKASFSRRPVSSRVPPTWLHGLARSSTVNQRA